MKTAIGPLIVLFILTLITSSLFGQSFEGRILYRVTYENSISESKSVELSKDNYYREAFEILYFKNNQYKSVLFDSKTQKPCYTILYDPLERRMYYNYGVKCGADKSISDFDSMLVEKPEVFQNENDTIHILGKKCKSITIYHDSMFNSTIYYSTDYRSDMDSIANNIFGFPQYCILSESIPLKIIGSGFSGIKTVYIAIEIIQVKLNARIFKPPKKIKKS